MLIGWPVMRRRYAGSPRWLWFGNLALLIGLGFWMFADPAWHTALSDDYFSTTDWSTWRRSALLVVLSTAAIHFLWLASGFWFGATPFRTLVSLLMLIGLISLWFGLALNCRDIAWHGRLWRIGPQIVVAETMIGPLIDHWPTADGEVEGLGPFMAYPVGKPTTLILLTPPRLTARGPAISAVENGGSGAICLELSDAGGNDWLEWHPQGIPRSHVGGLYERRDMERATRLTEKWYLVRYRDTTKETHNRGLGAG